MRHDNNIQSTSSPHFSGDIAKICKLSILGTLGMPGYIHTNWYYQLVDKLQCLSACQK